MEIQQRRTVQDKLSKYDYCSNSEYDYVEVTEWTNSEGIDVTINSNNKEKTISLSFGELDAINYLKMTLEYQK